MRKCKNMARLRKERYRLVMATALAALCVVLVSISCTSSAEPIIPNATVVGSSGWGGIGSGSLYTGLQSMEELIVEASAIARVRFKSARQTVEEIRLGYAHWLDIDDYDVYYSNAIEITFEVKQYLKGSGGTEIQAVLYDKDNWMETRAEVEALNHDLLPLRSTQWDNRDAIVFLRSSDYVYSTVSDTDRYWMLALRVNGEDAYTVGSDWARVWLPAANAPGARRATEGANQQFLIGLRTGAQGASRRSGSQGGQTMGLGEIQTLISKLQTEMDAGGTEAYAQCVRDKYREARYEKWWKENRESKFDWSYYGQYDVSLASGQPARTSVYVDDLVKHLSDEDLAQTPSNIEDRIYIGGQDAELFAKGWPLTATTARPLPDGVYRLYWTPTSSYLAICDGEPELRKTRNEIVVTVTAPEGTVHETMFDPVTLGSGVGVDGTNGVISAGDLTVGGTSTSISGLKWDNNQVVLSWSSHTGLGGHTLDFIELDGSVGLSLGGSDATADATAKTLTWAVTEKPWNAGDLLMLRISATGFRVSVVASDATPSENEPVDFSANIVNAPSKSTPSYNWEMNFGGDAWTTVSSSATLRYLEKPDLRRGVRVTVSYPGGESQTSEPLWVTWE